MIISTIQYDNKKVILIKECKFCKKITLSTKKNVFDCNDPKCKIRYIKESRGDA